MILRDPVNVSFISKGSRHTQVENYHPKEKGAQDRNHRLQEKRAERAQPDCRTLLTPDSHWVISQFFLEGKGHTFDCQDLGMNKKSRGYWERYKWGHPSPYHALLLLLLLLSVNIVWKV